MLENRRILQRGDVLGDPRDHRPEGLLLAHGRDLLIGPGLGRRSPRLSIRRLVRVAAGILAYGIGALQTVGWLTALDGRAFDISSWFTWSAWYGEIVQGVFNITPTPTVLQLLCWLAYLVVVLTLFLRPVNPAAPQPRPAQPTVPVTERSAL